MLLMTIGSTAFIQSNRTVSSDTWYGYVGDRKAIKVIYAESGEAVNPVIMSCAPQGGASIIEVDREAGRYRVIYNHPGTYTLTFSDVEGYSTTRTVHIMENPDLRTNSARTLSDADEIIEIQGRSNIN